MFKALGITAALAALAVAAFIVAGPGRSGEVSAQTPVDIAIDMDVTGNDARLTGGADIQDCVAINQGDTVDIDVLIPPPGVAESDGIKAWEFDLLYDPSIVQVTGEDQDFLLMEAPGSNLLGFSQPLPDTDGTFKSAAADFGAPPGIEPGGVQETGPGVLTRITLTAVGNGVSDLTLDPPSIIPVAANNDPIPVNNILNAKIAVGESCPTAEPTPTPTPTATPTPTPAPGETPTPTPTPAPGETPTPTPTPAPGETPTPTPTPAPGETPTPTPTPAPGETPTPTPTPTPIAGEEEATPTPTPTPSPAGLPVTGAQGGDSGGFPFIALLVVALGAFLAAAAAGYMTLGRGRRELSP